MKRFAELRTMALMVSPLSLLAGPAFAGGFYSPNSDAVKVSVAYADNTHNTASPLPSPWYGSPGVNFIGTTPPVT